MKWLRVDGGPILLIPEVNAHRWEGSDPPSQGRVVNASSRWNDDGPATDYDRACDVNAWIGAIAVGGGHALVVATESENIGLHQSDETRLIEWFYGPDETQVLEHFLATCRSNQFDTSIEFRHPGGRLILMSAADIVTDPVYEILYFELPARNYLVRTKYVVDGEISYVAHQFT